MRAAQLAKILLKILESRIRIYAIYWHSLQIVVCDLEEAPTVLVKRLFTIKTFESKVPKFGRLGLSIASLFWRIPELIY